MKVSFKGRGYGFWFCLPAIYVFDFGEGKLRLTVGVADGLAVYKKAISNFAIK